MSGHTNGNVQNNMTAPVAVLRTDSTNTTQPQQVLSKAVERAGLKSEGQNVTLHTMRHTLASQLAIAGVPLRDIQELMGHQNFETTLQYAHLSEEHIRKQVLRLPFSGLGHKLLTKP